MLKRVVEAACEAAGFASRNFRLGACADARSRLVCVSRRKESFALFFAMDASRAPLAYLVLGAADSGRGAIIADLISNGLESEARPVLLASTAESPPAPEVRERLSGVSELQQTEWRMTEPARLEADVPPGATHVFVLADGRSNPVDQIEAFHAWLPSAGAELARVITIVDCRLASEHPELLRWYDACVHFSDVVLLNRREGVPNKWVSDFTARFRKAHFPCLIEMVKHDQVQNPALILEPEARRMSMLFDEASEWPESDEDEDEVEEKERRGANGAPTPAAGDLIGAVDPYLERFASGRRVKEIPDIAKFLAVR